MSCPHSTIGRASFCSQCAGATVTRVRVDDAGEVHVGDAAVGNVLERAHERARRRFRR